MEDDVYLCSWSHSESGIVMWVKSNPEIRAAGVNHDEATEALVEAIQDAGGAIHAVLEFDPPLAPSAHIQEFLSPSIVKIWGDEAFEQVRPRRADGVTGSDADDAYYEGGCCKRCRHPLGERSDRTLELSYVRSGYGGGFVSIKGGTSYVFSERFLELLNDDERSALELRKVARSKRSRMAYYELIGPTGPTFVGLQGVAPHSGWVCEVCGHRRFGYRRDGFDLHDFVAAADLASPLPGIFTLGTPPHVELAATSDRWAELVGQPASKGMLSDPIGVLASHRVDRHPSLPTFRERELEGKRRWQAYLQKRRRKEG